MAGTWTPAEEVPPEVRLPLLLKPSWVRPPGPPFRDPGAPARCGPGAWDGGALPPPADEGGCIPKYHQAAPPPMRIPTRGSAYRMTGPAKPERDAGRAGLG